MTSITYFDATRLCTYSCFCLSFCMSPRLSFRIVFVSLTQSRRDRAQMALKSRSHEILMAEMTVLVKRYRRDKGRLYEVNRTLVKRLAELEAQVRMQYCSRVALSLLPLRLISIFISLRVQASHLPQSTQHYAVVSVTGFMYALIGCLRHRGQHAA